MNHHRRASYQGTEHHLSSVAPTGRLDDETLRRWFDRLAGTLAEHGVLPLQERLFGPLAERERLVRLRRSAWQAHGLDGESPCAFIDGRPGEPSLATALQLWGVTPAAGSPWQVATVAGPGSLRGRRLSSPDAHILWLTEIDGRDAEGRLARGVTAQAETMLRAAIAALERYGFTLRDVARTWIFLRRILDWYDEFNRVRTGLFREHGLTGGEGAPPFPASTGIQGTRDGEECTMELLAVQARGALPSLQPIAATPRQDRAFAYGSAFSRAMSCRLHGLETIFVSGTASIGPDGRSRHRGEPEAQAMETLQAIIALIEPRSCQLSDVVSGMVYLKSDAAAAAYEQLARRLELPPLPWVPVRADVCRPELLVEVEAVVWVPDGQPREQLAAEETGHGR